MTAAILIALISVLLISIPGALLLRGLARWLGKIENASFINSYTVCLVGSALMLLVWWGLTAADMVSLKFATLLVESLVVTAAAYITAGKLVWRCSWLQSVKANSPWIVLYAGFMAFMFNKFSSLMPR
jgi:hypothetical protein